MPIIQDPRMNAGREKDWGLAYFEENFEIGPNTYEAGHYFYRKDTGDSGDEFNPRFLPQGFPIRATQATGGPLPPQNIIDNYKKIYQMVISTILLRIQADPEEVANVTTPTPTTNLDSRLPMVAYLNRCISNATSGLPNVGTGDEYEYSRDNTTAVVGRVQ